MRVGVIDIGTNSTRLLVAVEEGGHIRPVATGLSTTRLGEGAGRRMLLPGAMARTVAAVDSFLQEARLHGADRVVAVATSAVRDAANRADFLELVKKNTGLQVRVLSGEEEAAYSYRGAVSGLLVDRQSTAVLDVGGGSTELSWQGLNGLNSVSVNMGAVKLTLSGLPAEQVAAAFKPYLNQARRAGVAGLVGVGGTITSLAAIKQELAVYDPERVHGYVLSFHDVSAMLARLAGMSLDGRRRVKGLQPERADIIVAGATIVAIVMEELGIDRLVVSECDLLYGLAKEEVERN